MLTVTSLTFSIVMVALVLASQQFSPRILRNFMSDHATQNVLGVFIGAFMYSMVVLGSISDVDEATFVPVFSTLIALGFALLSVGVFIYFINHIAKKIQANYIVSSVAEDIEALLKKAFEDELVQRQPKSGLLAEPDLATGTAVPAASSGYVQGIDLAALIQMAQEQKAVYQLHCDVGEFVVIGTALLTIHPVTAVSDSAIAQLRLAVDMGCERTLFADILFGIRQLVDIALKAISPGINDPTTAVNCLDYLDSILVQAAYYPTLPYHYYDEAGDLRLLAPRVHFEDMVALTFNQIRQYATSEVAVTLRLLDILVDLAAVITDADRQTALWQQAVSITHGADRGIPADLDRLAVNKRLHQLPELLDRPHQILLLATTDALELSQV
jgi:uncharacterized membrane protein